MAGNADPKLLRVPYFMILELTAQNAALVERMTALVERMTALELRNVTDGRTLQILPAPSWDAV